MNHGIQFIECPRDAMQGWPHMIATADKVRYLNALLRVGFHTIDFGSFVSPKLIPQMADTAEVVGQLHLGQTDTKLLAIVANTRGAADAVQYDEIHYLGFPFSISPTFQQRNTNSSPQESLKRVEEISELCVRNGRELVVYLSMGFGNPYGDPYSIAGLEQWMRKLHGIGVNILSIADTVGLAEPSMVREVAEVIVPAFPDAVIGVHLHAAPGDLRPKLAAAFESGCTRFDGAIGGIGGCPMAGDDLVGNMDSVSMIRYFRENGWLGELDMTALETCRQIAQEIFNGDGIQKGT